LQQIISHRPHVPGGKPWAVGGSAKKEQPDAGLFRSCFPLFFGEKWKGRTGRMIAKQFL
jgi:hypothetical protein